MEVLIDHFRHISKLTDDLVELLSSFSHFRHQFQTADEEVTNLGTGYITDIGMTGPTESVIGMDVQVSIKRFVTSLPERYKLAEGKCELNGCIFEIDDENGRTKKVVRLNRL